MKRFYQKKYRRFDTDIYTFEFHPRDVKFDVVMPEYRKTVTEILSSWWTKLKYTLVASANGSFFRYLLDGKSSPVGLTWLYEGVLFSDSEDGDEFMELIFDGSKLHVDDIMSKDLNDLYPSAKWGISLGNLLVKDGKKNLLKANRFDHTKYPNPRTMVGQRKDGTIILAVAEGRLSNDKGLTADQQADFMLGIGCDLAINADGGGSSALGVRNNGRMELVNDPSGGSQRRVANAFQVYVSGAYEIIKVDTTATESVTDSIEVIGKIKIAPNFTLDEIACRHCGVVALPDYRLITVAQGVRDHFGVPMRLVGTRCPKHNIAIGGDPNSLHMQSKALDISAWNGDVDPQAIYDYILAEFKFVKRVKLYPGSHVHIQTTWME